MDQELIQYLEERFSAIDRRLEGIDRQFEGVDNQFENIDRQFQELRGDMNAGLEEVKRHSGVLVEDLRYQVRLVAKGFATFVEGRYTQDQARLDERFRETQALIHLSYDPLRQRVENLERNRPN